MKTLLLSVGFVVVYVYVALFSWLIISSWVVKGLITSFLSWKIFFVRRTFSLLVMTGIGLKDLSLCRRVVVSIATTP